MRFRNRTLKLAAGAIGQPPSDQKQNFQITVRAVGRLTTPEQFENIILKNTAAGIVQLKDVGRAEIGAESYASTLEYSGRPAIGVGVQQLSNANCTRRGQAGQGSTG